MHTTQLTCNNLGLESRYKVSTLTHVIDFSKSSDDSYDGLATTCGGLDIGVLGMFIYLVTNSPMLILTVNNVGKSHTMPAYLVDTPKDEISDIVAINVNATLRVTYTILPGMVKRCVHYIVGFGMKL